jgi:protein tyrosine/serine phosphatase
MNLIYSSIKHNFLRDMYTIYEPFIIPTEEDNYNLIIDGIYLGNYDAANSKSFILDKNINLIINCSRDLKFPDFYNNIPVNYIRLPLNDSFDEIDQLIMSIAIPKLMKLIHKYLKNNKNVFVHCYAGMQRSATVVICYLMYKDKKEKKSKKLDDYYNFLKSKRTIVFKPDPTFVTVIENYYNSLFM